jgi:hypothetical protein
LGRRRKLKYSGRKTIQLLAKFVEDISFYFRQSGALLEQLSLSEAKVETAFFAFLSMLNENFPIMWSIRLHHHVFIMWSILLV